MFIDVAGPVKLIAGHNGARFPYANSLLIEDDIRVLVDTGAGPNRLAGLRDRVDVVINSHFHADHIAGNRLFPGAQVWAPELDAPALRSETEFLERTGFAFLGEMGRMVARTLGYAETRVDRELRDGEVLEFGRVKLRVIHLPGHTPGHSGFFWEEEGFAFLADLDLTGFGPWYGNPVSDPVAFADSIRKAIGLDARVVATGHLGLVADDVANRLADYLEVISLRDEQILKMLEDGATLDELVACKPIYGKHAEPAELYRMFEATMVRKHLEKLEREGRVTYRDGVFWRASSPRPDGR